MPHDKVYVVCEDMCLEECMTKEQITELVEQTASSEIAFKGDVATLDDLPDTADLNDTYYVQSENCRYTWNGTEFKQSSPDESTYSETISEIESDIDDIQDEISAARGTSATLVERLDATVSEINTVISEDLQSVANAIDYSNYGRINIAIGYLLQNDGTVQTSNLHVTTDFIPISMGDALTLRAHNSTYTLYRCLYDKNKEFIQYYSFNITDYQRVYSSTSPDVAYVRFSYSKAVHDNRVDIYMEPYNFDKILNTLEYVKKDIYHIENGAENILIDTKLANALLNNAGGESYNEGFVTTDYIPVNQWEIYEIIGKSPTFTLFRCLYDANKNLIGYVTVSASDYKRRYDVTPGVAYMRWSWSKTMQEQGIEIRRIVEQTAFYDGERVKVSKHGYKAKILFHSGSEPNNPFKSFQGFALNNNVLFQCLGDGAIKTYDFKTGNTISTFSAETGHGGSAYFSNEKYQVSDDFNLLYVATGDETDSDYTHTNVLKVTEESAETITSYRFENSVVGNGANSCVDFSQNVMYVTGYEGDISTPANNHLILSSYDLDSVTENQDGTVTPTLLWTKQLPFVYVVQSTNYISGQIWMLSSDSSGTYEAKIYVYDIEKNEFVSKIGFPDLIKYGEIEDIEFVERSEGQYDVLAHSRTLNWNYLLLSFD